MDGQTTIRKLVRRLLVGLNRAGLSVRGAQELRVQDKHSRATLRALVFPVEIGGLRYVVSGRPNAPWVKSLRAAHTGELRVGRHGQTFRATAVGEGEATTILRVYERQVSPWFSAEPHMDSQPVAFRMTPAEI